MTSRRRLGYSDMAALPDGVLLIMENGAVKPLHNITKHRYMGPKTEGMRTRVST